MKYLYVYNTRVGPFYIADHEGRFHAVYQEQSLGSYERPQQAADDLAGGHTYTPSTGIDTATLGIPDDLGEWQKL